MPSKIKVQRITGSQNLTKQELEDQVADLPVQPETPIETVVVGSVDNPVVEPIISSQMSASREDREVNKAWMNKAEVMRRHLESQPKVRVLIPLEGDEQLGVVEVKSVAGHEVTLVKSGAVWSKTFNGYRVVIPKGVYTDVPQQVADNISQEYNQTQTAGRQWSLDRLDPKTGRPVRDQL